MSTPDYLRALDAAALRVRAAEDAFRHLSRTAPDEPSALEAMAHADQLAAQRRRVRADALRTGAVAPAPEDVAPLRCGALEVDRRTHRVTVAGQPVRVSGRPYDLLCVLASDPGRVWTKATLLATIWAWDPTSAESARTRTVDSHAARLRRSLAAAGFEGVVNCHGVGYSLLSPELAAVPA